MGKRIISQARGRGGPAYTVRRFAYRFKISYPMLGIKGVGEIVKLISSAGHSAPLAKIVVNGAVFYIPAAQGIFEGQKIEVLGEKIETGDIIELQRAPIGTKVFNIENSPGDGGKMVRTSGGFATVLRKEGDDMIVALLNKKEIRLNGNCRATVGIIAGQGRNIKPFVKAGKKHYMMLSKGRKWHRTSAVKMNVVDHPFGGGRGKRIKSKIAKRNAPPGAKVGHIRPRRTGIGK